LYSSSREAWDPRDKSSKFATLHAGVVPELVFQVFDARSPADRVRNALPPD